MIFNHHHKYFWLLWFVIACLQLMVMTQFELFGDEAFYWLEGQFLSWSYAELPGFTAWVSAFSEWLLPHHPFFLRLIPWLAASSLPFLLLAINRLIHPNAHTTHPALLLWSLPLVGMVSVLSLPDIWLLFFTILCVFLLLQATKKQHNRWYLLLGLALAVGINIHLRFWLLAGIFGMSTLWIHRQNKTIMLRLLTISLPLLLLGFLPILWFNFLHDFPLLAFQLKDRHPWEFQLDHLYFIPVQILVSTPFVLLLWLNLIPRSKAQWIQFNSHQKVIISTALIHWMLYFLLGFFSDNMRLNLHWPLLSYILLFSCFSYSKPNRLVNLAVVTGTLAHLALLSTFLFWSQQTPLSKTSQRITGHAQGWSELALKTKQLMQKHDKSAVLADHFMTAAELAYQFNDTRNIKTIEHSLSDKHGRSLQLQIMGIQPDVPSVIDSLIIIEQTAIKLQNQVSYYLERCQQLGGLRLLSQFNTNLGNKTYHFFEFDNNHCDLPVLFYSHNKGTLFTGWALTKKDQLINFTLSHNNQNQVINSEQVSVVGHKMFNDLDPKLYVLNRFKTEIKACSDCSYQLNTTIKIKHSEELSTQTSQRFYP